MTLNVDLSVLGPRFFHIIWYDVGCLFIFVVCPDKCTSDSLCLFVSMSALLLLCYAVKFCDIDCAFKTVFTFYTLHSVVIVMSTIDCV